MILEIVVFSFLSLMFLLVVVAWSVVIYTHVINKRHQEEMRKAYDEKILEIFRSLRR